MEKATTKLNDDELHLRNRDEIQVAYDALAITGTSPEIENLLEVLLKTLPPGTAPSLLQSACLFIGGEMGTEYKKTIKSGLEIYIDNISSESDGKKAAQGLLTILQER